VSRQVDGVNLVEFRPGKAAYPSNPASGVLRASEALIGQLYLAIMIARMVGLQISQRNA
jgi:hypothetical protein